jgi:hypothetical protein
MSSTVPIPVGSYRRPILSDDTPAALASEPGIYTLAAGTYYVDVAIIDAVFLSVHMHWSAALASTITVWTSDLSQVDAPLTNTTAGYWVQQNPSTAYVPTGTGFTPTALTIVTAGTDAGGTQINLADLAASRVRLRIVVTVGGTFRCAPYGKA